MRKRNNLRRMLDQRATQSECGFDIRSSPGDHRRATQSDVGGFFNSPSSSRRGDSQSDFGGYARSDSGRSLNERNVDRDGPSRRSTTSSSAHFNQSFNSSNVTRTNLAMLNIRNNDLAASEMRKQKLHQRTQDTAATSTDFLDDFGTGAAEV